MPLADIPKASSVPPEEAIKFFDAKGYKVGFSYLDVWKEEHGRAFTAAKVMEQDILADLRGLVQTALENGTTFEDFQSEAKPLLDNSGWANYGTDETAPRRLRTIYDTNMRVARVVGQWQRVERTKRVLPYLQYNLGPSKEHRPEHVEWDGLVLPVDDPWWDTHNPPNGWGCKCWVRQVTGKEAESLGGVDDAPPIDYVDWKNPRTGEEMEVPKGIDPGWDYNPGKTADTPDTGVPPTEQFQFVPLRDKPKFEGERTWVEHLPGLPEDTQTAYARDGKYTLARATMHADIVKQALAGSDPVSRPTAIVMMGGAASGKTTLVKRLLGKKNAEGETEVPNFVVVNADDIKEQLPEYDVATRDPHNTAKDAAKMVHEESSDVAKQLLREARDGSYNLIFDGVGSNVQKYTEMIQRLKDSGYRVELVFPDVANPDDAIHRAVKRANGSGRWVPENLARQAHHLIPQNFERLIPFVDTYAMYAIEPNSPQHRLIVEGDKSTQKVLDQEYWQEFKARALKYQAQQKGGH